MSSATSDFLGPEYFWWDATIKLEDVQPYPTLTLNAKG
jgi:hypothetical protein